MGELSTDWWQQLPTVPYHNELSIILFTVLPVWACGAVIGLLVRTSSKRDCELQWCQCSNLQPSRHAAGRHTACSAKIPVVLTGTLTQALPQLPRPKWLEAGASAQVFFSSPVGLCLRRLTLLYQAAYLLRCAASCLYWPHVSTHF